MSGIRTWHSQRGLRWHKKYQADALVDGKSVKLCLACSTSATLNRYSWDATFAAAAGESEELAYRLNEIYNEQWRGLRDDELGDDVRAAEIEGASGAHGHHARGQAPALVQRAYLVSP